MANKRDKYAETDIISIDFEDGSSQECGIVGTFQVDGVEYIALEDLDSVHEDFYLYTYKSFDDGFELGDISDDIFDKVSEEFDRICAQLDI